MENDNLIYKNREKTMVKWITGIAIVIPVVVAVLLFMPSKIEVATDWVYVLPHLNAVINSVASLALIMALVFIKNGNVPYHRASISVAFGLGAIFLVSYVIYHATAESTGFGGEGIIRSIYYFILITHIVLAAVALFPILLAYYYGHSGQYEKHRKIVKFAYPIWLYVTITGVLVYWMISPYYNF